MMKTTRCNSLHRIQTAVLFNALRLAAQYRWMAQWPTAQRGRDDYKAQARKHLSMARNARLNRA